MIDFPFRSSTPELLPMAGDNIARTHSDSLILSDRVGAAISSESGLYKTAPRCYVAPNIYRIYKPKAMSFRACRFSNLFLIRRLTLSLELSFRLSSTRA